MTKKTKWVIFMLIFSMIIAAGCVSTPSEKTPPESEEKIIFVENFDRGIYNWSLDEGWGLEKIDNNTVLKGTGHTWARLEARLEKRNWAYNYTFKAKFKPTRGAIHFNYRFSEASDGPHRYFIGVGSKSVYLSKQYGDKFEDLTRNSLLLDSGWHELDIRGYGDTINIYIDDTLVIVYKDTNPILSGSIAFETLDDSTFLMDDVRIKEILPINIVAPS